MLTFLKELFSDYLLKQQLATGRIPLSQKTGIHEKEIKKLFGKNGLKIVPSKKNIFPYIICFTNRCGSNLLAETLATNPSLGKAGEYLNHPMVRQVSKKQGFISLQEYLEWLPQTPMNRNKQFGVKLSWDQLFFLVNTHAIPEVYKNPFYIHIYRRDVLAQAISMFIALQTKQWKSTQDPKEDITNIELNETAILKIMMQLIKANEMFMAFFNLYGITPVSVAYEDLVGNIEKEGEQILRALPFELADRRINIEKITLKKQSSTLSQEFRSRLEEKFNLNLS